MTIQIIARRANHRRAAGGCRGGGNPPAVRRSADCARGGAYVGATADARVKSTEGKIWL